MYSVYWEYMLCQPALSLKLNTVQHKYTDTLIAMQSEPESQLLVRVVEQHLSTSKQLTISYHSSYYHVICSQPYYASRIGLLPHSLIWKARQDLQQEIKTAKQHLDKTLCMQLDTPWHTGQSLKTVEPTAFLTCMVLESCCHNTKLVPRLQGWCRHPWHSRAFWACRYLCLEDDPCHRSRDSDILPEPAPTLLLASVKEISLTKQKYKS